MVNNSTYVHLASPEVRSKPSKPVDLTIFSCLRNVCMFNLSGQSRQARSVYLVVRRVETLELFVITRDESVRWGVDCVYSLSDYLQICLKQVVFLWRENKRVGTQRMCAMHETVWVVARLGLVFFWLIIGLWRACISNQNTVQYLGCIKTIFASFINVCREWKAHHCL